ncbi:MAG: hypothetical protein LBR11_00055 [Deltaproteobacteria bacterium]|jgi:hypothetical protein|nr:hypothetical protein [Deltaproteobacteria bacterium]
MKTYKNFKNNLSNSKIKILIPLLCLIIFGFLIYSCIPTKTTPRPGQTQPQPPKVDEFKTVIDNWNQYSQKFSAEYTLSGLKISSPQAVIDSFIKYTSKLKEPWPTPEAKEELKLLSEEVPNSVFHEYAKFCQEIPVVSQLRLSSGMEGSALAQALNKAANVNRNGSFPNYLLPDTVKRIINRYDFCTWLYSEKDNLQRKDLVVLACSKMQLTDSDKYKNLNSLININSPNYNR